MISIPGLHATRPATIDALRAEDTATLVQVLGVVGFALLTALGAQVRIYIWEVPFTLQTVGVYGSGLYLGWRNGLLSQVLYLSLGLFLPVFASDGYGPAYLLGALSAGYLLGYPLAAAAVGALSGRWNGLTGSMLSMLAGSLILFSCGVIWLHYAADHVTWFESIDKGWLRFVPIDLVKMAVIGMLYTGSRRLS